MASLISTDGDVGPVISRLSQCSEAVYFQGGTTYYLSFYLRDIIGDDISHCSAWLNKHYATYNHFYIDTTFIMNIEQKYP